MGLGMSDDKSAAVSNKATPVQHLRKQNKNIIPLALGNVEHLRVSSVLSNSVTLKFNV